MCRSVFIRDGFQFNFQISPDAGETPRPALPLAGGGGQPRQRQDCSRCPPALRVKLLVHEGVSVRDADADAPLANFQMGQTLREQAINPARRSLPTFRVAALVGEW
jgi:hypothetical protein